MTSLNRYSPIALAVASALLSISLPSQASFHNESVILEEDTTVSMTLGDKLAHNAAIGVDYRNPDKTFVVDTNGHSLTLTVGDSATPNKMHVGISALTSSANPGETKASDLLIKGNVQLNIDSSAGSAFGVRNTGMSDITIDGSLSGNVTSQNSYVMGIDNQKYASVTTINGDVNLKVSSGASGSSNLAYGLVAIGYPGVYDPNDGDVIDKERTQIVLNGNRLSVEVVGWAGTGIQAAQSGEVFINAEESSISVKGSVVAGLDISNATGGVNYKHGTHSIQTNVIDGVGPGTPGANVGISNRGTLNVGADVDSFNLSVVGVGGDASVVVGPTGSQYASIGVITDKFEGDNPVEGTDYNSHTNLLAKNVNISVSDGNTDANDASIGGILIQNGTLQTSNQTQLNMSVSSATTGAVHGLVAEAGSDVDVLGNATIKLDADNAIETTALKADNGGNVLLAGASNEIVGDITVNNQSEMSFEKGATTVSGEIVFDETSQLNMASSSIELTSGSSMDVKGVLQSRKGQILLNEATPRVVNISMLSEDSSLEAIATSQLNDKLGSDIEAFSKAVNIDNGAEGTKLSMREGLTADAVEGELSSDGSLNKDTVVKTKNTLMQSSLELASAAPLALNRIMMNDVRKRLGDIRTSNGTHGAWARYDGGKFSGDGGLENDFHTIQVGIDTVPTADAPRMGVAFSYTDSDAEYARGSADMKAYSLAMYSTWMGDNGQFFDLIGRMGTADTDMVVDGQHKGSMDNVALSMSGEFGWRFDVTNSIYVEPQVEATYTYVNEDSLSLSTANYDVDAVHSLLGRIGFAAGMKCPSDYGNVYVRASAVHEFLGDSKITGVNAGNTNVYEIDGKDTWFEYGIGANFNITKSTYMWADVERTTGGALDEDWRATVGVRYAW